MHLFRRPKPDTPELADALSRLAQLAEAVPALRDAATLQGTLLRAAVGLAELPTLMSDVALSVLPRELVTARLLKRHGEEGLFSAERNRAHVERVDLANYDLVQRSRPRADLAIDLVTEI